MLNITRVEQGKILVNTTGVAKGVSFHVDGVTMKELKSAARQIKGTTRERALALRLKYLGR